MVIWKFPFEVNGVVELQMPADAEVLSVQVQSGVPCLWALVDPNTKNEPRRFRIFGTGHEYPEEHFRNLCFVDTIHNNGFVFHVFEEVIPTIVIDGTN